MPIIIHNQQVLANTAAARWKNESYRTKTQRWQNEANPDHFFQYTSSHGYWVQLNGAHIYAQLCALGETPHPQAVMAIAGDDFCTVPSCDMCARTHGTETIEFEVDTPEDYRSICICAECLHTSQKQFS